METSTITSEQHCNTDLWSFWNNIIVEMSCGVVKVGLMSVVVENVEDQLN